MLNQLGEFGLIAFIKGKFNDIVCAGCEGIGDDCAVIPISDKESMVVTSDMLVEDIHFLHGRIPMYQLGRKSLAVNLSDVASMGATPFASFLSISIPPKVDNSEIEQFIEGYHSLSAEYDVALLGGDTTKSHDKLTISVTAIGRVDNANIKLRKSALCGDTILVSGVLGESARGLKEILNNCVDSEFMEAHYNPKPPVHEGIWLGGRAEVRAMMDISDGVASDLKHILRESGVGAVVKVDSVPHNSTIECALTGGEDYKLLLTCSTEATDRLCSEFEARFNSPLYPIGQIVAGGGEITWIERNRIISPQWSGFSHF